MSRQLPTYWVTKDKGPIPYTAMATGHLVNALKMLRRNGYKSFSELDELLSYPPPNGEMAQYYYESELQEMLERANPAVDAIEQELAKRKEEI